MSVDARAQKLWPVCEPGTDDQPAVWLARFEAAGMIVIDPTSEATIETAGIAIGRAHSCSENNWSPADVAGAVFRALRLHNQ